MNHSPSVLGGQIVATSAVAAADTQEKMLRGEREGQVADQEGKKEGKKDGRGGDDEAP